jgi:hypothetical protein
MIMRQWTKILAFILLLSMTAFPKAQSQQSSPAVFRAGAAMVDITPTAFPVIVNGMVEERTTEKAHDALMSRAIVLDDGSAKIAIVVVDSLMLTRAMLDDVKEQACSAHGDSNASHVDLCDSYPFRAVGDAVSRKSS